MPYSSYFFSSTSSSLTSSTPLFPSPPSPSPPSLPSLSSHILLLLLLLFFFLLLFFISGFIPLRWCVYSPLLNSHLRHPLAGAAQCMMDAGSDPSHDAQLLYVDGRTDERTDERIDTAAGRSCTCALDISWQ